MGKGLGVLTGSLFLSCRVRGLVAKIVQIAQNWLILQNFEGMKGLYPPKPTLNVPNIIETTHRIADKELCSYHFKVCILKM